MHETGIVFPKYLKQLFQLLFRNGAMLLHVGGFPASASLLQRPFLNYTNAHKKILEKWRRDNLYCFFFFCHKPELYLELSWPHRSH